MIGSALAARGVGSSIGLDIGARTVKAVQVRRRGAASVLSAAVEFARTGPAGGELTEEEAERIESVLYRRGFVGSRVSVAVPRGSVFWAEVERPPRGKGVPEAQIVRAELARAQRVDPGSFEQVWWDVPQDGRRAGSVVAVGCERETLTATVDRFDRLGVEVSAIDLPMPALLRAAHAAGVVSEPFGILLDLGWSAAAIGVIYRGAIVYERQVPAAGTGNLVNRIVEGLDVDPDVAEHLLGVAAPTEDAAGSAQRLSRLVATHAELIGDEVDTSLQYAAHRFRADPSGRVVLCGGGAEMEGVLARCQRIEGCTACVLRPAALLRLPDDAIATRALDRAGFVLAASLAMRYDR